MLPCCVAAVLLLIHFLAMKRGVLRFFTGRTREDDHEDEFWSSPKISIGKRLQFGAKTKTLYWGLAVLAGAVFLLCLSQLGHPM